MNDELPNVDLSDKRVLAGLAAIFLGALGVHKFILGYMKEGGIMLAITFFCGMIHMGMLATLVGIVGIIEGVIYLKTPPERFHAIYIRGTRPWF